MPYKLKSIDIISVASLFSLSIAVGDDISRGLVMRKVESFVLLCFSLVCQWYMRTLLLPEPNGHP